MTRLLAARGRGSVATMGDEGGLLHLFYAGFAANICIPFKDYGIRALRARGYNVESYLP